MAKPDTGLFELCLNKDAVRWFGSGDFKITSGKSFASAFKKQKQGAKPKIVHIVQLGFATQFLRLNALV